MSELVNLWVNVRYPVISSLMETSTCFQIWMLSVLHLLIFIGLQRMPNVYHPDAKVHLFNVNETAEDEKNCAWHTENETHRRATNRARGGGKDVLCFILGRVFSISEQLSLKTPTQLPPAPEESEFGLKINCWWKAFNTESLSARMLLLRRCSFQSGQN